MRGKNCMKVGQDIRESRLSENFIASMQIASEPRVYGA